MGDHGWTGRMLKVGYRVYDEAYRQAIWSGDWTRVNRLRAVLDYLWVRVGRESLELVEG